MKNVGSGRKTFHRGSGVLEVDPRILLSAETKLILVNTSLIRKYRASRGSIILNRTDYLKTMRLSS